MWDEQFRRFVERKERSAREARTPHYITEADLSGSFTVKTIHHPAVGPFTVSVPELADLPYVNLVFVQSKPKGGQRFGNTGADNPGDIGGGETDKHIVYEGVSRFVDAVLAGANTVRRKSPDDPHVLFSVWHPEMVRLRTELYQKPRHPAQVLVTESGNIDPDAELIFNVPEIPVFVLTTDAGRAKFEPRLGRRSHVRVVSTGITLNLRRGLRTLRMKHGIETISAIGGRTTATALIDARLVTDLYLTTGPHEDRGEPDTPFYAGERGFEQQLVLRKRGTGEEEGVIFEHWIIG